MTPGRRAAASILCEVDRGRRLDVAWEASGAARSPERAWIRALVYATVRLRGRIDHLLAYGCNRALRALDAEVLAAMRMGACQIVAMGGVPAYAAVSEAVEQVKRSRRRSAAGLVNATLRKVARHPSHRSLFPCPDGDPEGYLSTWGSHPAWLVRRWISAFGADAARALVEANNREPELYLRPVGVGLAEAERRLARRGFVARGPANAPALADAPDADAPEAGAPHADAPNAASSTRVHSCLRLAPGVDPGAALAAVPGVIQDPAASLVVDYAAPPAGALVADLCAAPGGKTMALLPGAGAVVAGDLSPRRLERVREAARRLGATSRVRVVVADARRPPFRRADVVLADVPCSGTGTLRRHPDGRWRLTEESIGAMAALQREILDGVAAAVSPGGLLVYATCAVEHEENEGQVDEFLKRHPDFQVAPSDPGTVPERFLDAAGRLAVRPFDSGFDGAFAARLRRIRA